MAKIYTKTGDKGYTSLIGGDKVLKSDIRIEAYGATDELNAYIGLLRDQKLDEKYKKHLLQIQNDLFVIGAFLALDPEDGTKPNGENRLGLDPVDDKSVIVLENWIDEMTKNLAPMTHFILPGGHVSVSFCHVSRTVCRRLERNCVQLNQVSSVSLDLIKYINRLSDYLFTLARMLTKQLQIEEIKWVPASK